MEFAFGYVYYCLLAQQNCHLTLKLRRRRQVVFYAAVFRAFDMAKSRTEEAIQSMQKGQLVLLGKNDPWLRTLVKTCYNR